VTAAKLLDFGLAKLARHGERPALVSETREVTEAAPVTARGTILGTLQYMAPEQLEGKEADARTDLWALGAILYEMLTGKRAFEGASQVSLIGNIMNAEPAGLATLQPLTSPSLDRVVTKCLAKHPDGRWDTAHDVADELRWISQTSGAAAVTAARPRRRFGPRVALVAAGVLAGVLIGGGAMWMLRPAAPAVPLARLSVDVRPADELNAGGMGAPWLLTPGGSRLALAWTPDGKAIVFVGRRGTVQQLYVRRLDAAEARPLAGTEGAQVPAVSADGEWVTFWAAGVIRKVPLAGGPAMDLASGVTRSPSGMVWDANGRVFFGSADDGRIWQIPPDGVPAAVTATGEAEVRHVLPCPLPGGRALLYTVRKREWSWGDEEIVGHTLTTGARKVLLRDAADARYLPTGHLVFLRRGTLFGARFDAERVELLGPPVAVLDNVVQALTTGSSFDITGAGQFAVAPTGTLAWIQGPISPYPDVALVAVDRRGRLAPLTPSVRSYGPSVRRSPDGRRLAVTIRTLTEASLWLHDLDRGILTPLPGGGEASWPVWSPDGRHLVFSWLKDGRWSLAWQRVDGAAPPEVLAPGLLWPSSWTPDARQFAVTTGDAGDVSVAAIENGRVAVKPLLQTPHTERWPEFSPDGRWLAYASDVSGRSEVYVRPYPGLEPAEQVSVDGGWSPAWNPNGQELFFLAPHQPGRGAMMAVEFGRGPRPRIGRPEALFDFDPVVLRAGCSPNRCYDVSPDGQRFFAVQLRPAPPLPPVTHINLILNWFEELKAKVPVAR
jgi:serine/threonine-protein kinase